MAVIRRIFRLARPYWLRIIAGIALSSCLSGITAAIAWAIKPALDLVLVQLASKQYGYLQFLPLGIIALFALKGGLTFGQTYIMKATGQKFVRETRNDMVRHLIVLPTGYFGKEAGGSTLTRVMSDVSMLEGIFSDVIKAVVVEIPTVIFLLGVAFYRRWDLTLMILLLLPVMGYSTKKLGKRVKKKRKEVQHKLSILMHRVNEIIQGAKVIKIFTREEALADQFRREHQRYYQDILRLVRIKELSKFLIDVATGCGIAVAVYYGILLIIWGKITPGDLGSIVIAIYMVFSPVKRVSESYSALQEIRATFERIDFLMHSPAEEGGAAQPEGFTREIRFDNVSFAYPGETSPVLENVNLSIRKGEVVALVGRSGMGKSTLVDLLPKFYKATEGAISIDGTNVNDMDLRSLRGLIGVVSQDVILFNATIRENILFGRAGATDEEIRAAARMAYADEFITEMPEGYDTVIGDRGLRLSGGQRQRIAIARAVLKNPPILILDEATSALDSVSEALVQKALESLMKGRTTIVIAHRLSTVRNADRIVVIDRGRVVDEGTHDALMSVSDTYARLYNAFASS